VIILLPPPLYVWEDPKVSLEGQPGWAVRFEEEKNFLPLPGIEQRILSCPASSLVTILTTLTWPPCSYIALLVDSNIHYNTLSITIITVPGCTRDFLDPSELLNDLKSSGFLRASRFRYVSPFHRPRRPLGRVEV